MFTQGQASLDTTCIRICIQNKGNIALHEVLLCAQHMYTYTQNKDNNALHEVLLGAVQGQG